MTLFLTVSCQGEIEDFVKKEVIFGCFAVFCVFYRYKLNAKVIISSKIAENVINVRYTPCGMRQARCGPLCVTLCARVQERLQSTEGPIPQCTDITTKIFYINKQHHNA